MKKLTLTITVHTGTPEDWEELWYHIEEEARESLYNAQLVHDVECRMTSEVTDDGE